MTEPTITPVKIAGRSVGPGQPCFIVGEIGSNHCRDKGVVRDLIDAAAAAKFDAVKFQTYDPELAFTRNLTTTELKLDHIYGHRPWWEVARDEILMPRDWFPEMFAYARQCGLITFCTGHHRDDLDFLVRDLAVPVLKVASIDAHYRLFLKDVLSHDLPVILATGMATVDELDETVGMFTARQRCDLILLHCVSCYPPRYEDLNLRNIIMLQRRYGFPVGYSDHSPSNYAAIASVALGCCLIEKHITLDRTARGPDHIFALEPAGMAELVRGVREVEAALGSEERMISAPEQWSRKWVRRSIIARADIPAGGQLTEANVKFGRPAGGIDPNDFLQTAVRRTRRAVAAEEIVTWAMLTEGGE